MQSSEKHNFKVLHFGGQCPWFGWTLEQVQLAAAQLQSNVEVLDVGEQPELAAQYRLFFPFMTVIDDTLRWPSPSSAEGFIKLVQEPSRLAVMSTMALPVQARASQIVPLTLENIESACAFCLPGADVFARQEKRKWAERYGEMMIGYLALEAGRIVGGIEYLRASKVPFPLPEKRETTAFITCLYSSEDEGTPDYRGHLLEVALCQLPKQGYQNVQVVAGQRSSSPNGPSNLFRERGFREIEILDGVALRQGTDALILMEYKF